MSYKSEFQNLWKKTINQIKVDIDQNAKVGKINTKLIKNNYIANAKKWETSVYREGEWLESIGNDDFSRAFIKELNDIEFSADIPEPAKNYIGIVIAAARGLQQLQIVHHHEAEIRHAAALGVHIRHGEGRVVVDADVGGAEGLGGLGDAAPLPLGQLDRKSVV